MSLVKFWLAVFAVWLATSMLRYEKTPGGIEWFQLTGLETLGVLLWPLAISWFILKRQRRSVNDSRQYQLKWVVVWMAGYSAFQVLR